MSIVISPTSEYHLSRALIGQREVNIHPYSLTNIHAGRRIFLSALF